MAEASWRIEPQFGSDSLGEFRHWAASWMHEQAVAGVAADDVIVVLTELVTNSIQHTCGPIQVVIGWNGQRLRAGVTDCSSVTPRWPPTDVNPEGGRGLMILDGLCTRWGLTEHPPEGKTVWFEFAAAVPATGRGRGRGCAS
jgi:hypothetical protein